MIHKQYNYIYKLIEANIATLLVGVAGCGKSTIAMQIAEELGFGFSSVSCTKQMSVNALMGFISINGIYIPSPLRKAYETGSVFLLDELDAADANVLLCLNTIENGFISFPDKIIEAHPNFRLIATANPLDAHSTYTGRSKLDFSTMDRYFVVEIDRDDTLEILLTSQDLFDKISTARSIMTSNGVTKSITMRDSIRMHKLQSLNITNCIFEDIIFKEVPSLYTEFVKQVEVIAKEKAKAFNTQSDVTSIDNLFDVIQRESKYEPHESENKNWEELDSFVKDIQANNKTENIPENYKE